MESLKSGIKIYNWVLVGTTGTGKSSTANFLAGSDVFKVSDGLSSCTASCADIEVVYPTFAPNKVKIIDTVGFGDTKMSEDNVFNILREFTSKVIDIDSTCQIDAFLLVTSTAPRFMTLKEDIERLIGIFGSSVLKSTIILVIDTLNKGHTDETVLKAMNSDDTIAVSERIAELKGIGKVDENCFIVWDNLKPRPDQFKKLVSRMQYLKPYTHKDFQKAKEEMKEKYDRMAAAIEKRIKREYDGQFKVIQEKIAKEKEVLEKKFNAEMQAREKAEEVIQVMKTNFEIKFNELNTQMQNDKLSAAETEQRMREHYENQMNQMRDASSKSNAHFMELMMKMQSENTKVLADISSKIHEQKVYAQPSECIRPSWCPIF